jgi:hypothetical protein
LRKPLNRGIRASTSYKPETNQWNLVERAAIFTAS